MAQTYYNRECNSNIVICLVNVYDISMSSYIHADLSTNVACVYFTCCQTIIGYKANYCMIIFFRNRRTRSAAVQTQATKKLR